MGFTAGLTFSAEVNSKIFILKEVSYKQCLYQSEWMES